MIRKTTLAVLIGLIAPAILLAGMKFYEVVPYRNYIGLTDSVPPNNQISQTFINVVDSLTEIHIWVGDIGNGEAYDVEVVEADNPFFRVAYQENVTPSKSWSWLHIPLEYENSPVRGKTYKAVFTRAEGAPISYAYDPTNPYPYGSMPGDHAPNNADLAMRAYGAMDAVDSSWFDSSPFIVSSFV